MNTAGAAMLLGISSQRILKSWTIRGGSTLNDPGRVSNIALEGWNGSTWVNIDTWASPGMTQNSGPHTRNSSNFTNNTYYLDFRTKWTFSSAANSFCSELQLLDQNGVDMTTGCSPTHSGNGSMTNPEYLTDDNTSTSYGGTTDCPTTGLIHECNVINV